MKRSNSNSRYSNQQSQRQSDIKNQQSKNKTLSTVIQTEHDHQLQTTKKNSLHKVPSSRKLVTNTTNKNGFHPQTENRKTSAQANFEENLFAKNKQLAGENKILREQFCKLQEVHIQDKAKIQTLISRMSQMKSQVPVAQKQSHNSTHRQCQSKSCIEQRKKLEVQLHRERIKVYELEQNKKKWQMSREQLKEQYKSLFEQIQVLKQMN